MSGQIRLVLNPRTKSLGAFHVRRALPSSQQKMVGPFIFFDHIGPAEFPAGKGIDVRPHPHVCLSTVTYLFEGAMLHRDTLGTEIEIRPGAVNWMTAGKGIAHSERTPAELEAKGYRLHGIQTWVALPRTHEDMDPEFAHHPADTLPEKYFDGFRVRMIAGSGFGMQSPVQFPHPIFYAAVEASSGGVLALPNDVEERAFYVVSGSVEFDGQAYSEGQMVVLNSGGSPEIHIRSDTRVMLLGGATMDGRRWIDWNFVASSKERIEQAKADWRASIAGNWQDTPFGMPPNENEYIPLPEDADS